MPDLLMTDRGAIFSPCKWYRYRLWRRWAEGRPCLFIMLNPSTADEVANDPTVERCERRVRAWGYPGLEVVNLFAFRATDPKAMKAAEEPIGCENEAEICSAASDAALVVCAWGNHGRHLDRSSTVRANLQFMGVPLHYLALSKTGEPQHPLYLPYELKPVLWQGEGVRS
jgi:hypothetical protein